MGLIKIPVPTPSVILNQSWIRDKIRKRLNYFNPSLYKVISNNFPLTKGELTEYSGVRNTTVRNDTVRLFVLHRRWLRILETELLSDLRRDIFIQISLKNFKFFKNHFFFCFFVVFSEMCESCRNNLKCK